MKETLVEKELILIRARAIVVMTKATPRGARARARASARAPQGWARTMEVAGKRGEAREAHHREEADADAAGHLGSTIHIGTTQELLVSALNCAVERPCARAKPWLWLLLLPVIGQIPVCLDWWPEHKEICTSDWYVR